MLLVRLVSDDPRAKHGVFEVTDGFSDCQMSLIKTTLMIMSIRGMTNSDGGILCRHLRSPLTVIVFLNE